MWEIIKKLFLFIPSVIQYRRESRRLSHVDFFDYKELLKGPFILPPFFNSVLLYGNNKAIESITHRRFNLVCDYLEHGVCFHDTPESTVLMGYATRPGIKHIYTYSEHRKAIIEEFLRMKNIKKDVIAVGPYIAGAKNFHSQEELLQIKHKYGKILLVYPSHSIDTALAKYDEQSLIDEIRKHEDLFDNIFICLYWKDILNQNRLQHYIDNGFTIVCNGLGSDPNFLSRQKDLISLADMVMTNGLGTHIGYAVYLNKPVYFYQQNHYYTDASGKVSDVPKLKIIENTFITAFCSFSFTITTEQRELVKEYWGTQNT